MTIYRLPSGKGFASRFTPAPIDKTAFVAVDKILGSNASSRILQDWHRPRPTLQLVREALQEFDNRNVARINCGDYYAILAQVMDEFKPEEKLVPFTLGGAFKHADFPRGKSPGLPYIQQRNEDNTRSYVDKASVWLDVDKQRDIRRRWDLVGKGHNVSFPDCAAFNRVVASKQEKVKVRPVWGYPLDLILEEARFFYPLFNELKRIASKRDFCYGLGLENACGGQQYLADMHMKVCYGERQIFVADWSKFDSTVPAWLIRDIFCHMAKWFDFSKVVDSEGKFWHVNPVQSLNRWNKLVNYFINTPIRLPSGERFRKDIGVPSGSMFTNIIDTFVNAVVMRFTSYHTTGTLPFGDVYYGDDSVSIVKQPFCIDNFADFAATSFGMNLNRQKSYVSQRQENMHWLGFYHYYGLPVRNNDFLLASFIFPERIVKTVEETAARCIGQMFSTLDGSAAYVWYTILQEVLEFGKLEVNQITEFIRQNFRQSFKYLETLGWTKENITLPSLARGITGTYIPAVEPQMCKRTFRGRKPIVEWINSACYPPDIMTELIVKANYETYLLREKIEPSD